MHSKTFTLIEKMALKCLEWIRARINQYRDERRECDERIRKWREEDPTTYIAFLEKEQETKTYWRLF